MKNKEELIAEYKKYEKEYFDLMKNYPWWNPHTNRASPLPDNVKEKYKKLNSRLRTLKGTINQNNIKGE